MKYKLYEDSLNDPERVMETILRNRGIPDPDVYLNLDSSCCNEYEDLNNIEEAVKCFDKHFERRDDIAVLVDCDP
jgi:single-stranded-DNA-specific exonuclease